MLDAQRADQPAREPRAEPAGGANEVLVANLHGIPSPRSREPTASEQDRMATKRHKKSQKGKPIRSSFVFYFCVFSCLFVAILAFTRSAARRG
jgi:hypothetical protein